ncbi:ATP-binding protein [Methanolobus sp. ZRKC2]|uniref:ATP-binding protein n=1 Tax=Methanolobus sp. ZRKC2 TaxID=3125783 RepID=UPI00324DE1A6
MPQNLIADYLDDSNLKGYRLHKLEIYNWGTFNQNLWVIDPQGFNSLMTGANGSGKSTLVDALITLLVHPSKIVYNQAGDAKKGERSVKSYVLGSYTTEKDTYNNAKPVNLRDGSNYSVLLCYFYNRGIKKGMTLAQIFSTDGEKVKKFFVTSEEELSFQEHIELKDGETDIFAIKKRIKNLPNTLVFDSHREYSLSFQRYFGIRSEKVLDLFFQTVSMKNIDELTPFMRHHMLEETNFTGMIKEMLRGFKSLTSIYESIQKDKKQISMLGPMITNIKKFQVIDSEIEELNSCKMYLPYYIGERKYDMLTQFIKFTKTELAELKEMIQRKKDEIEQLRDSASKVELAISQNAAGNRVRQLQEEIKTLEKDKTEKKDRHEQYVKNCISVGIAPPYNEVAFKNANNIANEKLTQIDNKWNEFTDGISEAFADKKDLDKQFSELDDELQSLKLRTTQIPSDNLAIRADILRNCAIDVAELPFVGELIKVRSDESEWEGALERLLHNFGLSMLVPEEHYKTISKYVNQTNLKGRLVYFRVPDGFRQSKIDKHEKDMVVDKIESNEDSRFHGWIYNELITRFNLVCCDNIEDFQKEPRAITQKGQIKGSGGKHEKDDRWDLQNRRKYVLGWDNKEKVRIMEAHKDEVFRSIQKCASEQAQLKEGQKKLGEDKTVLSSILSIKRFDSIDWQSVVNNINEHQEEITKIRESSNDLQTLEDKLLELKKEISRKDDEKTKLEREETRKGDSIRNRETELCDCIETQKENPYHGQEKLPDVLVHLTTQDISLDSIEGIHRDTESKLAHTIDTKNSRLRGLTNDIVSSMTEYRIAYPEETFEFGNHIEDIPTYSKIYARLLEDDLPKHENEFRKKLQNDTWDSISRFSAELHDAERKIKRDINKINEYLRELQYNPNTYFQLTTEKTTSQTIREFRNELKDCLQNSILPDDNENEKNFQKVKSFLDKFKGTDTSDNIWINTVTDVRNWLVYAAEEKSCTDNRIIRVYSDLDGSSGGQKGKLACTILASALAYRFGPGGDNPESNSFRFVILDEAFPRASDDTTRYGFDLFDKLNLQILVVTPERSIDVIADYVNFIHVVSNTVNGDNSKILNMTIQKYREEKTMRQQEAMAC